MDILLNQSDLLVLASLKPLEGKAYGVTIRDYIEEKFGKDFCFATIYASLLRLEQQNIIFGVRGRPTNERGRKCSRFYQMNPAMQSMITEKIEDEIFTLGKVKQLIH